MKNTVKRISILASAFVMTASFLFSGMSASADKEVDLTSGYASETIQLSDAQAIAGNCVMVNLSLNTGDQCTGYNLEVEFDSELTLKKVSGAATWEVIGNVATIIGFSATGFEDGSVATLYFETPETASGGSSYNIGISNVSGLLAENGDKIEEVEVRNSVVEVVEEAKEFTNHIDVSNENGKLGLRGDADNDGTVSLSDAVKIAKYMLNKDNFNSVEFRQADVDEDGSVGLKDAVLISKYILCDDTANAWTEILK